MYQTFEEIKRNKRRGDLKEVSDIVGCSRELVKKVVHGERKDRRNIKAAFNLLFDSRKRMTKKLSTLNELEND